MPQTSFAFCPKPVPILYPHTYVPSYTISAVGAVKDDRAVEVAGNIDIAASVGGYAEASGIGPGGGGIKSLGEAVGAIGVVLGEEGTLIGRGDAIREPLYP